jgi:hypothetical protein
MLFTSFGYRDKLKEGMLRKKEVTVDYIGSMEDHGTIPWICLVKDTCACELKRLRTCIQRKTITKDRGSTYVLKSMVLFLVIVVVDRKGTCACVPQTSSAPNNVDDNCDNI